MECRFSDTSKEDNEMIKSERKKWSEKVIFFTLDCLDVESEEQNESFM